MSLTSDPTVPPTAKRLRPQADHDQDEDQTPVQCPRCDSSNTKFCYYNNYSLSQPRYFCKSCRRYWTKGGTLRNIPIGGVSRKNKRLASLSATHLHRRELQPQPQQQSHYVSHGTPVSRNSIGPRLSYPSSPAQFSESPDFMFENLTIDFIESGFRGGREYNGGDYFSSMVATSGYGSDTGNIHGSSPFGDMTSYYDEHYEKLISGEDVKPKLLDLGWRDQTGCHSDLHGSGVGKNGSSGYVMDFGPSWAELMNGYGSSSTSPLV